jgi:hypothetical protein
LDINEFLRRDQIAFSEKGLEHHFLRRVIDNKSLQNSLLSYKHGAEIETVALVVLIVYYVS